MHVRACFYALSLLSFHFTLQFLTQKRKMFLPYKVSQSLSLCMGKMWSPIVIMQRLKFFFLTLSIPFHIELLRKFVHVTPWELRKQSDWWVTWNFSVIPFHFLSLSLREEIFPFLDQSVNLCPSVWKHLWSPILIMRRPRKMLRNVVFHWLASLYSFSVFVGTNFPKAKDFYGRNLQAHWLSFRHNWVLEYIFFFFLSFIINKALTLFSSISA